MKKVLLAIVVFLPLSLSLLANSNTNKINELRVVEVAPSIPIKPMVTEEKDNQTKIEERISAKENKSITDDYKFYVGGYFAPIGRIVRNATFTVGGHVAVDFHPRKEFSLGPYVHGEYFFAPLGSATGYFGGLEMELEGGVNFTFNMFEENGFALKLGCDFGYYMQWLQYNNNISTKAHLTYNGLMLRPTFTIQFAEFSGMPMGIALFYQKTAIVPYSDYDGFGVMLIL